VKKSFERMSKINFPFIGVLQVHVSRNQC
jgi:hypothetical protein